MTETPTGGGTPATSGDGTTQLCTTATVTAIVVTYNSADVLPGLLASLPEACAGLTWRLVVADNDSQDDSLSLVEQAVPDAQLVRMGRNAGYSAAINAAVDASDPQDAVLVLNPDVRLHPGSVGILLAALRQPGVGITVPRLLTEAGSLIHTLRREPTVRRSLGDALLRGSRADGSPAWAEIVGDEASYDTQTTADWATGAALLISRACREACGPWDESFFLYSEETEFCLRAKAKGLQLRLAPDALAVHLGGESKSSPSLWALLVSNRVRLYRRSHSRPAAIAFWLVALLRECSRAMLGRATSRRAVRVLLSPARMRAKGSL